MVSLIGIFVGLALLIFCAYKGVSTIWAAPICALIVAAFGGLNLIDTYAETYMTGFIGFTKSWFPTFMLGAIFGKIMDITGAAKAVGYWVVKVVGSKRAILAVVLSCAAITYGGVSLFVAIFIVYPLASSVFKEANITEKLIPGCFTLGAFTFTMTAIPGSPQIQNLIPMQYLGTTPSAAPVLGLVTAAIMLVAGTLWLTYRQKQFAKKGIGFTGEVTATDDNEKIMNPLFAFLPLVAVVVILAITGQIIISLAIGIVLSIVTAWKKVMDYGFIKVMNEGAAGSMGSIINTSAVVGFGSVVKAVAGFGILTEGMMNISGNPLVAVALAVNVLAGATGSASGGLGIALEALGEKFAEMSASSGIPMSAIHRVASLSSGGLDSLPHNGGVVTCLSVCKMTHKEAYLDMCVTSVIIPILTTIIGIILASLGLVF
ncbi:MAG: GntP family permease [Bacillota bacterium]|nr:GntP family permease [Bacillota bacterium]